MRVLSHRLRRDMVVFCETGIFDGGLGLWDSFAGSTGRIGSSESSSSPLCTEPMDSIEDTITTSGRDILRGVGCRVLTAAAWQCATL